MAVKKTPLTKTPTTQVLVLAKGILSYTCPKGVKYVEGKEYALTTLTQPLLEKVNRLEVPIFTLTTPKKATKPARPARNDDEVVDDGDQGDGGDGGGDDGSAGGDTGGEKSVQV